MSNISKKSIKEESESSASESEKDNRRTMSMDRPGSTASRGRGRTPKGLYTSSSDLKTKTSSSSLRSELAMDQCQDYNSDEGEGLLQLHDVITYSPPSKEALVEFDSIPSGTNETVDLSRKLESLVRYQSSISSGGSRGSSSHSHQSHGSQHGSSPGGVHVTNASPHRNKSPQVASTGAYRDRDRRAVSMPPEALRSAARTGLYKQSTTTTPLVEEGGDTSVNGSTSSNKKSEHDIKSPKSPNQIVPQLLLTKSPNTLTSSSVTSDGVVLDKRGIRCVPVRVHPRFREFFFMRWRLGISESLVSQQMQQIGLDPSVVLGDPSGNALVALDDERDENGRLIAEV